MSKTQSRELTVRKATKLKKIYNKSKGKIFHLRELEERYDQEFNRVSSPLEQAQRRLFKKLVEPLVAPLVALPLALAIKNDPEKRKKMNASFYKRRGESKPNSRDLFLTTEGLAFHFTAAKKYLAETHNDTILNNSSLKQQIILLNACNKCEDHSAKVNTGEIVQYKLIK